MGKFMTMALLCLLAWQAQAQLAPGMKLATADASLYGRRIPQSSYTSFSISSRISMEKFKEVAGGEGKRWRSSGLSVGFHRSSYSDKNLYDANSLPYSVRWSDHDFSVTRFWRSYHRITDKLAYYMGAQAGISLGMTRQKNEYSNSSTSQTYHKYLEIGAHGQVNFGVIYRLSEKCVLGAHTSLLGGYISFRKPEDAPFYYSETHISGTTVSSPAFSISYVLR